MCLRTRQAVSQPVSGHGRPSPRGWGRAIEGRKDDGRQTGGGGGDILAHLDKVAGPEHILLEGLLGGVQVCAHVNVDLLGNFVPGALELLVLRAPLGMHLLHDLLHLVAVACLATVAVPRKPAIDNLVRAPR